MSLQIKLTMALVIISTIVLVVLGWQGYSYTRDALTAESFDKLTIINATKKRQIETYFERTGNQALSFAESPSTIEAITAFSQGFIVDQAGDENRKIEALRNYYQSNFLPRLNQHRSADDSARLEDYLPQTSLSAHFQSLYIAADDAGGSASATVYNQTHSKVHPAFKAFASRFHFSDILLADLKGNIVYSVAKKTDFATNLNSGPYADSAIAKAYSAAANAQQPQLHIEDYSRYAASLDEPKLFLSAPIFADDSKLGVAILKIDAEEINSVMSSNRSWKNEGLGATGESYLVADDFTMRSSARLLTENPEQFVAQLETLQTESDIIDSITHLNTTVSLYSVITAGTKDFFESKSANTKIINGYMGKEVLSAYTPVSAGGLSWGLFTEITSEEEFAPLRKFRDRFLTGFALIFAGLMVIAFVTRYVLLKQLTQPLRQLINSAKQLGTGNLNERIETNRTDEIGQLAQTYNEMVERLHETSASKDYVVNVVDSMEEVLLVLENKGGKLLDTKIIDANKTVTRLLGVNNIGLRGEPLSKLVKVDEEFAEITIPAPGNSNSFEALLMHEDGSEIPVLLSITPLMKEGGTSSRAVCLAQDISAQREIESLKEDIRAREKIDALKSEFVSTVSHELRTPLTSIRGALGLVSGGMAGELPEKASNLVSIANNNCDRLINLINDILDIEKLQAGKVKFDLRPMNIYQCVQESIEANQGYADKQNVSLELASEVGEILVRVDANRLAQVMSNLISNAAKFSHDEGTVSVTVERRDDQVRVAVIDQGSGIPEDYRSKIFQRFSQADSSDTRQKGGTGLGLSITKSIVERFGGSIDFDSEEGKGTTFYFDLPILEIEPVSKQLENLGNDINLSGEARVLICEDEPDIATLLTLLLRHRNFKTHVVNTAEQALEEIKKEHFDAITVDMMLPGKDGLWLIDQLQKNEATKNLPVIVVSAKANHVKQELASQAAQNIYGWINKPIDEQTLITLISSGIDDNREQPIKRDKPLVLHVEDDTDIQLVFKTLLDPFTDVISASTIGKARQLLQSQHFDLIILDVNLPDGTGYELLPDIRNDESGELAKQPTPTIIFSADEIPTRYAEQVDANFVKSRISNDQIVDFIEDFLTD